jgi:diguanylate cyclase (GGDEF)-like protein
MLLKAVSARLAGMLRRSDFAARLGGDEFVIVQTGVSQPGEADLLARRLARALARPYVVGGQQITIGASVGYALSSEYGNDLERLLRGADEALCQVKREGGGIAKYEGPLPNIQFSLTA